MEPVSLVNVAFYQFRRMNSLAELQALRTELRQRCAAWQLKGTILISLEGVNAMASGSAESIAALKDFARAQWGVESFKEGSVAEHSFRRMLVKIKKEIISVGDPELRPDEWTAPRLEPQELKKWLDEGRDVLLLDTRNTYEIELGTFKNAEHFGIETSRSFTEKARNADWQKLAKDGRPIVSFCTGGIRCEKASAALLKLGLENVYQLNGGILRYFEETAERAPERTVIPHYDGTCFVFDWRLAVDPELKPTARSEDTEKTFGRHLR